MEIDLHGLSLSEAITDVIWKCEEALNQGDDTIYIIHGYRGGFVLKNYFRSKKFESAMKKESIQISFAKSPNNQGTTAYRLKKL
jgi:DNA-nicking Smr family endonuclease